MKYSLINAENDDVLIEVDSDLFKNQKLSVENNGFICSVVLEKNDQQIEQFQYLSELGIKEQEIIVATSLGSMNLKFQKGGTLKSEASNEKKSKTIKSSMPGKILKILCKAGDLVEFGQPLLIIEAMKMENEIRSTLQGKIEKISIQLDQKIETGENLITIVAEKGSV